MFYVLCLSLELEFGNSNWRLADMKTGGPKQFDLFSTKKTFRLTHRLCFLFFQSALIWPTGFSPAPGPPFFHLASSCLSLFKVLASLGKSWQDTRPLVQMAANERAGPKLAAKLSSIAHRNEACLLKLKLKLKLEIAKLVLSFGRTNKRGPFVQCWPLANAIWPTGCRAPSLASF